MCLVCAFCVPWARSTVAAVAVTVEKLWKSCGFAVDFLWISCGEVWGFCGLVTVGSGKVVVLLWISCGFLVEKSGDFVEISASDCGFSVEKVEVAVDNSLFLVEKTVEFGENLEISTGGAMMTESR